MANTYEMNKSAMALFKQAHGIKKWSDLKNEIRKLADGLQAMGFRCNLCDGVMTGEGIMHEDYSPLARCTECLKSK